MTTSNQKTNSLESQEAFIQNSKRGTKIKYRHEDPLTYDYERRRQERQSVNTKYQD